MPPWPAAAGFGDFSNDRSLSPVELELLTAWTDGDTPLGNASDAPVGSAESDTVADAVLRVPARQIGRTKVERIEVPAGNMETRWITGWAFRPGDAALVERAVLSIARGDFLGSWVPGDARVRLPPGVAQRLPRSAVLAIDLHYRKSSATQMGPGTLELSFGRPPGRRLQHRALQCDGNHLEEDVEVLAITPLASSAGDSVDIVARRPDGSMEPLVVIPQFDPGYPVTYRFRNPVPLPATTLLNVRSSSPGCSVALEFIGRRSGRGAAPTR
jgi:hypothetical protein